MKDDMPPVARGIICVDFDGTIFPWGSLSPIDREPYPGAVDTIKAFKHAGYKVMILTSRLSKTWHTAEIPYTSEWKVTEWAKAVSDFEAEQYHLVVDALNRNGIPFDGVTGEKIPAEFYIDDRAIEFHGDWADVKRKVFGG